LHPAKCNGEKGRTIHGKTDGTHDREDAASDCKSMTTSQSTLSPRAHDEEPAQLRRKPLSRRWCLEDNKSSGCIFSDLDSSEKSLTLDEYRVGTFAGTFALLYS
jgi:hypothetical protein